METGERRRPGFSWLILTIAVSGCSAFRPTWHGSSAVTAAPAPADGAADRVAPPAEMTFTELVDKTLINTGCCEKPPEPDRVRPEHIIRFDSGSVALGAEAQRLLLRHAFYLKRNPDTRVQVEGHADDQGTPEYHIEIGERRARAVADFLLAHGARPAQVTTVSFGDARPLVWEGGVESRVRNLRVELVYREP